MALTPGKNAPEADLVQTPQALADAIISHWREQISGTTLDPCRGTSKAFTIALQNAGFQPSWCEILEGVDFFNTNTQFDWIIGNPPWSKLRSFLCHAMQHSNNVVFLATMTHFVTRARLRDISEANFGLKKALLVEQPPSPWPASGFQLVAMHAQRGWNGPLTLTVDRQYLSVPVTVSQQSATELGL